MARRTRAPSTAVSANWLRAAPPEILDARRDQAELLFRKIGITFAVYGEKDAAERLIPFDIIPRLLGGDEWARLEAGLIQRVKALNMFLTDIYGRQEILKAGIVPPDLIFRNECYRPEMQGHRAPARHLDPYRRDRHRPRRRRGFLCPRRQLPHPLRRVLHAGKPRDDDAVAARPVRRTTPCCRSTIIPTISWLRCAPPRRRIAPTIRASSSSRPASSTRPITSIRFLADKLGVELVEGRDLTVRDDIVYMKTTEGEKRVDVIYRRVDDDFLDPLVFRPDSVLGAAGLMGAYLAGNVTLANAPGAGVADDKAVYTYMPDIIRFYLGEEAKLKNVATWRCREQDALKYVLEHLSELVVKEVNGSGGYGMLVGPHASKEQIETFRQKLLSDPDGFIAQPTLSLSTCPTSFPGGVAPRHVDLRPFVLSGADGVRIVPGGLTRVALKEGSLVVNSSQGGGTKDTWVLATNAK